MSFSAELLLIPSARNACHHRWFLQLLHLPVKRGDGHFTHDVIGLCLVTEIDDVPLFLYDKTAEAVDGP
jgi:hypothetical protein